MGFGDKIHENDYNVDKFKAGSNLWEYINEIKERVPWNREIMNSFMAQVAKKGFLSEKQTSLAVKLYADCCVMSDARIEEQIEARFNCFRLSNVKNLGAARRFVISLLKQGDQGYTLSTRQISTLGSLMKQYEIELNQSPDIDDFDGWNRSGLDNT